MPYTDLRFKAGINKEITPYSEENGWVDCDKVRFRFGYPEKLNGWEKNSGNAFLGLCLFSLVSCFYYGSRTF